MCRVKENNKLYSDMFQLKEIVLACIGSVGTDIPISSTTQSECGQ